jgi:TonB family protein
VTTTSRARWRPLLAALLLVAAAPGCRQGSDGSTVRLPDGPRDGRPEIDGAPVPLNPNSPAEYPAALLAQGIEGTVLLRLFVDDEGTVANDSTRIAESSGYPALDSAALAAAPRLRYTPALRDGAPVAALFFQPVQFRRPAAAGSQP